MAVVGHNGLERSAAAANDAARRVSQFFAKHSGRLFAQAAPAVEILLAAAIGLVAVLTAIALFTPLPTPDRLPAAEPQNIAASAAPGHIDNPFRAVQNVGDAPAVERGPDLAETSLNLVLHGAWVDEDGGSAIIKTPDGRQGRFAVGDEIWNGVRLDHVYRDQVVIISGGVRESLRLVNRDQIITAPAAPRQTASASTATSLGDAVRIVPRAAADGVKLTLEPGSDRRRFETMGLRAGDILVAVDNRRIGPEIASEIERLGGLTQRSAIAIVVERDGVPVPLEIDLAAEKGTQPDDN